MAIGVYFQFPDTTVEQYDEASSKLNNGRPMTRLSDWPVDGCLSHTAWQEESGALCIFDVWESAEAFQSFGEQLAPILGEVGFPDAQPHLVKLHNFVGS